LATGKSDVKTLTSSNMGVRISWSETYDPINNKSTVNITDIKVMCKSYYGTFYPNGSISIDGTVVNKMSSSLGTHNVYLGSTGSYVTVNTHSSYASHATYHDLPYSKANIAHAANGTKTITISVTLDLYNTNGNRRGSISDSFDITLTAIDRVAPTVSVSATPKSSSSFEIKATSTSTADLWEYSLDGGSTWTQYSTTSGTSASTTLTGKTSAVYNNIMVRARRAYNQVKGTSGKTSCDITLPSISFKTSSITANSVYVAATAGVACNKWEYSIDDGSTWTQFSTTSGATASTTISGLTPNTEYPIKVRVKKTSNGLSNTSSATTIKTLGGTVINSVTEFAIDDAAPVILLNWTVFDASYTHTLQIKNGNTVILTITGLTGSAGTNNKTIELTSAQRNTILQAMTAMATLNATFALTTYNSNSVQIGTVSTKTGNIKTTAATSSPTMSTYVLSDTNAATSALMDGDLVFIQTKSSLRVVFTAATPKNEATIAKYQVTVGSKTVESVSTTVDFGSIAISGRVEVTLKAVDSRGWSAKSVYTITVLEYSGVAIDTWSLRRVNEVDETATLELTGHLSELVYDGVARNSITNAKYRSKKASDPDSSYSAWTSLSDVVSDGSAFSHTGTFATFDPEYAFDVQIRVEDEFTPFTVILFLNKGTPLLAYRSKKLGINNNSPQYALDVVGGALFSAGIHAVDTVEASTSAELKEAIEDWFEAMENGATSLFICDCGENSGLAGLGSTGLWFIQAFRISSTVGAFWAYSVKSGVGIYKASLSEGTLGNFASV